MSSSNSRAVLDQGDRGYRYNQDSFLLADFFRPRPGLLGDFCAGSGVVSILIRSEHPQMATVAVELNRDMALMAGRNAAARGYENYRALAADVMEAPRLFKGRPFGAIVSNPPYRKFGMGRLNPDPAKALARHEIRMTLEGLVRVCAQLLAPAGTLTLIMITERLDEYLRLLEINGFVETRRRDIRHYSSSPAKLFMSEAALGPGEGVCLEPPMALADGSGWSGEYRSIMARYAR